MANHLWRHLANTVDHELSFPRCDDMDLKVYTDAAYGAEPHGCTIVLWGNSPVMWRSARQGIITTSTAASEMLEMMEGAVMTEAVRVVVEEVMGRRALTWQLTDSAAALAIVAGETASWRTRHLRKRARYLRWKIARGDVALRHCPGVTMLADLGTKPLQAIRLNDLKLGMGMWIPQRGEAGKPHDAEKAAVVDLKSMHGPSEAQRTLQVALIAMVLARAAAQEDGDQEGESWFLEIYTAVVVIVTGMITWWLKSCWDGARERKVVLEVAAHGQREERLHEAADPELDDGLIHDDGADEGALVELRRDMQMVPDSSSAEETDEMDHEMRLYITPNGRRYHSEFLCPGLRSAQVVIEVQVCSSCYLQVLLNPGASIYSEGPRGVFHVRLDERRCGNTQTQLRSYTPCRQRRDGRRANRRNQDGFSLDGIWIQSITARSVEAVRVPWGGL